MKKIQQLKAKKGFTLVEMIIVLAIIGVLIALIVPAMMSSDIPSAGKSYAKDFYYAVQTCASRKHLSGEGTLSGDHIVATAGDSIILYAEVGADEKGRVTNATCGIAEPGGAQTALTGITDANQKAFVESFMRIVNERVAATSYSGTFYAVIDDRYRVSAAYWTDGEWSEVDSKSFTDNCVLETGVYACAYPVDLCMAGGATVNTVFA
ncbi:MAG: prepilin-type N-terminal cleavage/methylation domain-containing protein [Ruminiclostridium sp.]|nr:prepilin-type N-terminal cleavage/methylation domain-containing protein [Ruminiclostridium sp.]